MAYEVLARKWRPQQFDDMVGQEHVTETLKNAIAAKRIAHAYIFTGPRGIGKTSLARIFAKALNCAKGPTPTPCCACDACIEIAAGRSLDVLEIDGASNTQVDHIRELRENVKYAPANAAFKIYIIDEVHMLSTGAFNALLKTLEEPPPHVKFIFATTEVQKVLPTILSRCQRFDLRRIPVTKISERLKLIAKAEKIKVDDDALLAIARGADGGLRDAESALDQLIAFCGTTIGEKDVLAVFGLVARQQLENLAEAILAGDIPGILKSVAELDAGGKDLQRLLVELLDHFRNLLVLLCAGKEGAAMVDITEGQLATCRRQAGLTDVEHALRIADILTQTEDRVRYALSRRTLIETALIRCARAATVVGIDELVVRVGELSRQAGGQPAVYAAAPTPPAPAAVRESAAPAMTPSQPSGELDLVCRKWPVIVEKVVHLDPMARGDFADLKPIAVATGEVVLGYDPEFSDAARRLETSRAIMALQNIISAELNRKVIIRFQSRAPQAPAAAAGPSSARPQSRKKTAAEVMQDPLVRKTMELFNGHVTEVRDIT